MGRKESLFCRLFFGLVCLLIGPGIFAAPLESWRDGASTGLQGVVRSAAGEVLADVELLVFPGSHSNKRLARLTTDRFGRFEGPVLPPGAYRVAVLKEGYGTLLTLVDLFRRHPIELILSPESLIDPERRESYPKDSSWAKCAR